MRITVGQLRRIIKETVRDALAESEGLPPVPRSSVQELQGKASKLGIKPVFEAMRALLKSGGDVSSLVELIDVMGENVPVKRESRYEAYAPIAQDIYDSVPGLPRSITLGTIQSALARMADERVSSLPAGEEILSWAQDAVAGDEYTRATAPRTIGSEDPYHGIDVIPGVTRV